MLGKDEILNLLLQNDYAEFFEALDTHGLNTSEYNQLKQELLLGKTDVYYNNRCKVLTNQFFKEKEKQGKMLIKTTSSQPLPWRNIILALAGFLIIIFAFGNYIMGKKEAISKQQGAEAWFKKGYETDNHDLKVNFYTKAIELGYQPLQDAYNNRGNAKDALQDYKGAITDYDQAIYLQPDYASAYYNRGIAKADLKDYQGAIADYDQAIYLQPDNAFAYNNRGDTKYNLKDYKGAITDYSQAIALKYYKVWKVHNYRGQSYYILGNYQAAIADWEEMEETAPAGYTPFYDYIDDARKKAK